MPVSSSSSTVAPNLFLQRDTAIRSRHGGPIFRDRNSHPNPSCRPSTLIATVAHNLSDRQHISTTLVRHSSQALFYPFQFRVLQRAISETCLVTPSIQVAQFEPKDDRTLTPSTWRRITPASPPLPTAAPRLAATLLLRSLLSKAPTTQLKVSAGNNPKWVMLICDASRHTTFNIRHRL